MKEKNIKAEIYSIIPYITYLNEKIEKLEKRVNDLEKKSYWQWENNKWNNKENMKMFHNW